MIKILFVCHGNICRSPMAEYVFRDMVEKKGLGDCFFVASSATSREEIGNPVHIGTRRILSQKGIDTLDKTAVQLKKEDYKDYDYLIGMDSRNLNNMRRMIGDDQDRKMYRLLDFTDHPRDIADPWYTGDFEQTYEDVYEGCEKLLESIYDL